MDFPPKWRWLCWSSFLLIWTTALLAPIPDSEDWPVLELHVGRKELLAKFVHVGGYCTLTILTGWLRVAWRYRLWLLFLVMVHGTATELLQLLVPGRGGSLRDVGIDHAGVFLGLMVSWKWWKTDS